MEETIKSEPLKRDLMKEQIEELKQYTEGIISVLRRGGNKPIDLSEAINRAFNNYKVKLSNRKITYFIEIEKGLNIINCDKRYFITILMNLIDNSIYWLETVYKDEKEIFFKAFKRDNDIHLIIADNGPGFKDDISDLIRPFFTRKEDGIGIGMYLVDTIMMRYGKFDIITDVEQRTLFNIPQKFTGAIVHLIFNKNQPAK